MEEKIKLLTNEDYKDVFALSQFAFQYSLTDEQLRKKEEEASRHNIWGWIEDGQLAAKVHLIPLEVHINDQTVNMGGIASVASWPEYRRGGIIKKLLSHTLQTLRREGYTISYLHPFSVPFYRKYGYELVFNNRDYEIPIKQFQKEWHTIGYMKRIDKEDTILQEIYEDYIKNYNGSIIRDIDWWKQRVINNHTMIVA
ncbi:GNAT family N-acetyltransferase [Gracilibacillus oryzae]|uniref:GNAT family N-acetyltransferase n=1 Tax=Gracilibacillus oryzae TaxID=1672701 RepID=A0A7C8GS26_9BACI|nr:GNAT family N-acetyltransferase [Gracilibacillus oryzae]KAB8127737.1 GNAT family N-acetyltransferase [Gracilibacillus oryzae]